MCKFHSIWLYNLLYLCSTSVFSCRNSSISSFNCNSSRSTDHPSLVHGRSFRFHSFRGGDTPPTEPRFYCLSLSLFDALISALHHSCPTAPISCSLPSMFGHFCVHMHALHSDQVRWALFVPCIAMFTYSQRRHYLGTHKHTCHLCMHGRIASGKSWICAAHMAAQNC